jgi:iron complex outermembrane receptor protein
LRNGFAAQDRLPSVAYLNDYATPFDPRRDYPGRQDREFWNVALRLKYDTGFVAVTSVSSFSHAQENGKGSGCYDDVNKPGIFENSNGSVTCVSNIMAYGDRAQPGQVIEAFQTASDDYQTFFQDLRVASSGTGSFKWLLGVDGMGRRTLDGLFNTYTEQQVAGIAIAPITERADERGDRWTGAYAQLGYTVGPWELTANGRYDNQSYRNTTFTSTSRTTIVPVRSPSGELEDTQRVHVTDFQPKGQISYHFNEAQMAYVTYSQGFRAGYFNTGAYGAPEYTTNYEAGIKTEWLDNRLQANLSGFHINYSNQQLSTTILVAPYRLPVTVPKTHIDGAEFETAFLVFPGFTLSGNLSYLDAKVVASSATVTDGTASPKAPHWNGLVASQYSVPLSGEWSLNSHLEASFHSSEYLYLNDTQQIPSNVFLNARIGLEHDHFGVYLVGQNLSDHQEGGTNAGINSVYYARYRIEPRSYGIELRAQF